VSLRRFSSSLKMVFGGWWALPLRERCRSSAIGIIKTVRHR